MDYYFSPYLSVYTVFYSTHPVFLRLIVEWNINLDTNFLRGAVLISVLKTCNCLIDNLLPIDLMKRPCFT